MLAYFAIVLTILLGFCGLAVDTARVEVRTTQLQAAADAGALAGASEVSRNSISTLGSSSFVTAANIDIASVETANNLPTNSSNSVFLGPNYGLYLSDYSSVQVTVSQQVNTLFLGIIKNGAKSVTVTVRAVAQMPPCMLFFGNPTLSGGFAGAGNTTWDYQIASAGMDSTPDWACPMYSVNGYVIDGFSRYSGAQVLSSAPAAQSTIQGSTWATPIYNAPVIPDPLAYVTPPTAGKCINSKPISSTGMTTGQTYSLTPGTYCGQTGVFNPSPHGCGAAAITTIPALDIEGTYVTPNFEGEGCPTQGGTNGNVCTSNPTLSLAPGAYVFVGGINLQCVTVALATGSPAGSGVTVYLTNSTTVPGFGSIQIVCTTWNASAPTTSANGGIPGVVLMTDRNWNGGIQDVQIHYSTWYADGILYSMRTGLFAYALPMAAPNYMNIIAANMYTYDAEVQPSNNYASLPNGNPLHLTVKLVQ